MNLPSNAEDVGLIPGQAARIPHAAGQLSLCAATEPTGHDQRARLPPKIPCATAKTQHSQVNKRSTGFKTDRRKVGIKTRRTLFSWYLHSSEGHE